MRVTKQSDVDEFLLWSRKSSLMSLCPVMHGLERKENGQTIGDIEKGALLTCAPHTFTASMALSKLL